MPPVLSAIVLKLLAKVAEERYQSAEGLKADLERCREELRRGAPEDFALGVHDIPTRFQLPQRLYGRDAQAAALLQGFERVARDGPAGARSWCSGYSGIGKSSVVHELHKPVVRQRGFFLSGKFDQFQRDIPYATLAQAIRGLMQQLLAGTDEELARLARAAARGLGGPGPGRSWTWCRSWRLVVGKQPPLPGAAARRGPAPLPPGVPPGSCGVFATPEHPLVVFLDDLQWADLASLQLLQHLLTQPETPPVLWIGAYRDNEVSSVAPADAGAGGAAQGRRADDRPPAGAAEPRGRWSSSSPTRCPGASAERRRAALGARPREDGRQPLLPAAVHADAAPGRPAGAHARGQAGAGMPRASGPGATRTTSSTSWWASCASCPPGRSTCCGWRRAWATSSRCRMLGTLPARREAGEVEQGLEPALQEGLLARAGPEQYRFLHDRIQQAAHALIPEEERKAVHLRIGRLLLASLSPEEVREKLFDVVSQLNAGAELIDEPAGAPPRGAAERRGGLRRPRPRRRSGPAVAYFTAAFELIPGDPWETDPELAFKVRLDRASCEFMSGNAAEARRLVEELRSRARTRADTAAAYRLKSDILCRRGRDPGESIRASWSAWRCWACPCHRTPPGRRWWPPMRRCGRCWESAPSRASSSCRS